MKYLIKYTRFNTDPIIASWISILIPGKGNTFDYKLDDDDIENIN